jgi:phosphohistidine swiveling domain-containing protein
MAQDLAEKSQKSFLEMYGHLRPGTYDILSPRYDEAPDLYFDWACVKEHHPTERASFTLSLPQMQQVERLLVEHKLDYNVVGIFTFMKAAIEGREYAKFIFTRTLSDVLSLLKELGEGADFDPEELSYIDIRDILNNYTSSWDIYQTIRRSIQLGKERYHITSQILLPPLITKIEDFYSFSLPENHPNFITRQSVTAPILKDLTRENDLHGKILFIPSADPGFDWIFTHGIAGFVTTYGGVNSHMAIRAGELGLPAIIGAGEKLYTQWADAHVLHIDCANQKVEIIR